MSLIFRPSCEALSRSITTVAWGASILRSVFRKMKRPVASASCRNFCATSFSGSNGPGVVITNWMGRRVGAGGGGATDRGAGDAGELLLDDRLELVRGERALVPRPEHVARDRLAGHVELEDVVSLLVADADIVDLAR